MHRNKNAIMETDIFIISKDVFIKYESAIYSINELLRTILFLNLRSSIWLKKNTSAIPSNRHKSISKFIILLILLPFPLHAEKMLD